MTKLEIEIAIKNKLILIWNDPDKIDGCDYVISKITDLSDDTCYIIYGNGSEAEVYNSEISLN